MICSWIRVSSSKLNIIIMLLFFIAISFSTFQTGHVSSQINSLTPKSDQDIISLYNIHTISTRQVMRIKKNTSLGIIGWSNTKFSELILKELYGWQWGELQIWSGSLRINNHNSENFEHCLFKHHHWKYGITMPEIKLLKIYLYA